MKLLFWRKKPTRLEELQKMRVKVKKEIKRVQEARLFCIEKRKEYSKEYSGWRRNVIHAKKILVRLGAIIPKIDKEIREEVKVHV